MVYGICIFSISIPLNHWKIKEDILMENQINGSLFASERLFQKVVKVAWTHIVCGHSLQSDGMGLALTLTLMARAIRLVGVTTGRCGQPHWSGQRQRPTNISELNTDSALVAVSSVPDQIGILAVTIKIISNFKCANKNIYCLQWPSGYWALGPLWLHNLNTKAI